MKVPGIEKPSGLFGCPFCRKTFLTSGTVRRHIQTRQCDEAVAHFAALSKRTSKRSQTKEPRP